MSLIEYARLALAPVAALLLTACAGGALQGRPYVEPVASASTAVLVNANAADAAGTVSILAFKPNGCYAGMTAIEPGGGAGIRVASGGQTLLTFSVTAIVEQCRLTEAFTPIAGARYEVGGTRTAGVCKLSVTQRMPDGSAVRVPTESRGMHMARFGCIKPSL